MTSPKKINFLPDNSEMGKLIQEKDWSKTPLGHPTTWVQSLRTILSIMLNSKFPMFLLWGTELTCFYNDAYRPSLGNGGKHPVILGNRGEDALHENWNNIKPLVDNALAGGDDVLNENLLFPIFRNNRMEDAYWTYSISAVNDESGEPAGVFVTCVETTNQVKAFKDLEESQNQLEFAISAANLGTWDFNPATNTIVYNKQLKEWFGYDDENEKDAYSGFNNVAENDRQKIQDALANAMTFGSDGKYDIQFTIKNPLDGKERIIHSKAKALFDENGVAYRLSGTAQDITDEVEYKKIQEEKIEFNSMLLENSPDCVKIIDSDGKISYMNENGVNILEGDSKEFFIDRSWESIWGNKESIIVRDAVGRAFNGQIVNFQASALTAKGTLKWWDVIVSALPDNEGKVKNLLAVSRDISGLKKTEKQLEESKEQLHFALEGGNLGFFDSYPQTGQLNWSLKTKEFFGLSPEATVNLREYQQLIHPDDYENAQRILLKALQNVDNDLYENEYRTSHEKAKWLKIVGKIKRDENGIPYRVTGVIQDITEKKIADIKLMESETNFRMLADKAPMWIWLMDEEVNVLYANPEVLRFVGVDDYLKFTGKVWETVIHPDDIHLVYENYGRGASLQQGFSFECRMRNASTGKFEWILVSVVTRSDEASKSVGFIGTGININQQKTQLFALQESEERFRTLAETLPLLVWVTDENGNAEYASGKWGEYSGRQSLSPDDWIAMVHPDDLEGINTAWSNSLATGNIYKYDVRLKSKNNSYRWFMVNGEPVYEPQTNRIIKWVGSFTDVHHEKSFSQELEKQVDERTKELLVAKDNLTIKNQELEKMNKELESFAYVSSHDLQEPLRKIQTFANRILEKENENLSDSGKEYLHRMRLAGERMQQLIQDLLAYSRTKTSDRKFEITNIQTILNDIKDDLRDEIKQKNVVIETNETCSISVKVIPFQFRQLMYNLISNSIKFSKTDGQPHIQLICEVVEATQLNNKNLKPNQQYYHLRISDNGIGFKQEYKEKIFEIFQRLHGREEYTGTGIGLAIVKKIIENHNGFISAEGELGVGATFDIYIPLK